MPGRLYVIRKNGTIVSVAGGRVSPKPFLDLRGQVASGELFVNYVGRDGDIYVTRFRAVHGLAALSSRRVLIRVPTVTTNPDGHYGGQLADAAVSGQ